MDFPGVYYGTKKTIAHVVWDLLGNPQHYIEPFLGSGAVLLARSSKPYAETVNDKDCLLINTWRAMKYAPELVLQHFEGPPSEIDLWCRMRNLKKKEKDLRNRLLDDIKYYDAQLAGYWLYWSCNSFGLAPLHTNGTLNLGCKGNRLRCHADPLGWLMQIRDRLADVRITCGDWSRVCKAWVHSNYKSVGIFLDPPYVTENVTASVYSHSDDVVDKLIKYCKERSNHPKYRIVIAGFEEYEPLGWDYVAWTRSAAFGRWGSTDQGEINRSRERLYYSPQCRRGMLF